MDKEQAKKLLMIPDDGLLCKVLNKITTNPQEVNLNAKTLEKIINKIIAYEYLINDYIVDENSIEMLRQNIDGVWVSYISNNGKQYAKVWFASGNPNLRKIFCGGSNEN